MEKMFWLKVIVGMVSGVAVGLLLSPDALGLIEKDLAYAIAPWIALVGNVFLELIKMIVIPLVMSSIIIGITSAGDTETLKELGLRIAPYFIFTTVVAVAIGMSVSFLLQPGLSVSTEVLRSLPPAVEVSKSAEATFTTLPDMIVKLIPVNSAQAELDGNILFFVILAVFMGVALINMKHKDAQPLLQLFASLQAFAMTIVGWTMKLAPYAVFGLLCSITIKVGLDAIVSMFFYIATVVLGLLALLCFYFIVIYVTAGIPPWRMLSLVKEVQLMAFSTSSSAAVMPLSIETAENKLKVPPSISKFVIPLGATVNMDGTALYQVCAAIFLTQLFGVDLSINELLMLSITTVGASIGAPSTPGVGIVILATILQNIGVPVEGIALILGVDRILDMCRTTINVTGDLTASMVMTRLVGQREVASKPLEDGQL
ncbi:dicarboxylate/amino acid:cation symporter [Thalassomonas actiniarum]|uniref:Dicarboxylate/amino acid:cation symporter n=1 Tax=Thalassomonas actiniarum TaxID=485447 RepID=A0AAF0C3F4_9GAMM|nr:dicarboxylate/amino acid:cation symporter [Thalassomonas actiniarum]WDD98634.1 dicarboxylate/amino acid:cation symporter [Thalassomonas actiniarum]